MKKNIEYVIDAVARALCSDAGGRLIAEHTRLRSRTAANLAAVTAWMSSRSNGAESGYWRDWAQHCLGLVVDEEPLTNGLSGFVLVPALHAASILRRTVLPHPGAATVEPDAGPPCTEPSPDGAGPSELDSWVSSLHAEAVVLCAAEQPAHLSLTSNKAMLRHLGGALAAALKPDHPDSAQLRQDAKQTVERYLTVTSNPEESSFYEGLTLGALLWLGEQLIGGARLRSHRLIQAELERALHLVTPLGLLPQFGDAGWGNSWGYWTAVFSWAAGTGDARFAWTARELLTHVSGQKPWRDSRLSTTGLPALFRQAIAGALAREAFGLVLAHGWYRESVVPARPRLASAVLPRFVQALPGTTNAGEARAAEPTGHPGTRLDTAWAQPVAPALLAYSPPGPAPAALTRGHGFSASSAGKPATPQARIDPVTACAGTAPLHEGVHLELSKLVIRGGPGPRDLYLLVGLMRHMGHAHYDAGAVLNMTYRGTVLLADTGYFYQEPRFHNGVVVRAGCSGDLLAAQGRPSRTRGAAVPVLEEREHAVLASLTVPPRPEHPLTQARHIIAARDTGVVAIWDVVQAEDQQVVCGPHFFGQRVITSGSRWFALRQDVLRGVNAEPWRNPAGNLLVAFPVPGTAVGLAEPELDNVVPAEYDLAELFEAHHTQRKAVYQRATLEPGASATFLTLLSPCLDNEVNDAAGAIQVQEHEADRVCVSVQGSVFFFGKVPGSESGTGPGEPGKVQMDYSQSTQSCNQVEMPSARNPMTGRSWPSG